MRGPDAASADSGDRSRCHLADPTLASRGSWSAVRCSALGGARRMSVGVDQAGHLCTRAARCNASPCRVSRASPPPGAPPPIAAARRASCAAPAPRAAEGIATVAAHRPLSSLGVLLPHRRATRPVRRRARPPFEPMTYPFSEFTRCGGSNELHFARRARRGVARDIRRARPKTGGASHVSARPMSRRATWVARDPRRAARPMSWRVLCRIRRPTSRRDIGPIGRHRTRGDVGAAYVAAGDIGRTRHRSDWAS